MTDRTQDHVLLSDEFLRSVVARAEAIGRLVSDFTKEELDALPIGTVVRDAAGFRAKRERGPWRTASEKPVSSSSLLALAAGSAWRVATAPGTPTPLERALAEEVLKLRGLAEWPAHSGPPSILENP